MKSNLLKIGLAGLLGLGAVSTSQAATKLDMATPWGGGVMLEYVARGAAAVSYTHLTLPTKRIV